MENMHLMLFICVVISCLFSGNNAQFEVPECPGVGGYVYIEHAYQCYFYACYNGALVSSLPYECPKDTNYYQLLLDSGVENACTSCAKVYLKPKTPATEVPPTETTTAKTTTKTMRETTTPMATSMATNPPASRTTTTMTSTQATVMKDIYQVGTNTHLLNGRWVRGSTSLRQCLKTCEEMDGCLGLDYNRQDQSCWVHDVTNICTAPQHKQNCIHFGLYNGCPATTVTMTTMSGIGDTSTTMTTGPTDAHFIQSFKGQHIVNGTVIPLAMEMANAQTCVAICRMDNECVGADFDTMSNSCWIHSEETECNEQMVKETCTHYRLKDICGMDSSTTPPGDQTTTTSAGSGTSERTEPDLITDGFVESVNGFHIPGGILMFSDVTLRQCLDSCLVTPYCLALDYDELDKSCYFHFRDTYCGQPQELHGVQHFKRLPCIRDFPNDVATTWYRVHVEQGQLLCTGCTLSYCLEACFSDMGCAGIDFDIRDLGCYLFRPETVCGPLIPKDYCYHVSRDTCASAELAGVPIQNLALTTYPPPAGLPRGWMAYPGIRVRNGVLIGGYDASADTCVSMCEAQPSCRSGDYDMADGSCWLHLSAERSCSQVEGSDTVFHFKKEKCDSVYGVMAPYVSPIWIAP